MSPRARIIALGQAAAGDDGVGLAVLERLRAEGVPPDVELVRAPEDFALVHLLETRAADVTGDQIADLILAESDGRLLVAALDDGHANIYAGEQALKLDEWPDEPHASWIFIYGGNILVAG